MRDGMDKEIEKNYNDLRRIHAKLRPYYESPAQITWLNDAFKMMENIMLKADKKYDAEKEKKLAMA